MATTPPRAAVVDLRQYRCHPGRREDLVRIFDEHFVEGQESTGMHVLGQFRDLDDPDRFVWLRGFDDLPTRGRALEDFYGGPVWAAHRDAANATMADSSDALLLNPVELGRRYPRYGSRDPGWELDAAPSSVFTVTVFVHRSPGDVEAVRHFLDEIRPWVVTTGAQEVAVWVSDPSENNFPALPLREDPVLVHMVRHESDAEHARFVRTLGPMPGWDRARQAHAGYLAGPPQLLRLRPTRRSHLR